MRDVKSAITANIAPQKLARIDFDAQVMELIRLGVKLNGRKLLNPSFPPQLLDLILILDVHAPIEGKLLSSCYLRRQL